MLNETIEDFSRSDTENYLKALIVVAWADGVLHENEKKYIDMQAGILSIDPIPYWEHPEKDLSFLNAAQMSRTARMSIIRDCIVLGYVDGDYDDRERKKVAKIASYLSIELSDVEAIELWLKEFWALLKKGEKLFKGK